MLKIGVTSCFFYPDLSRAVFGAKTLCYLERDMARYLSREGVLPILVPDLEGDRLAEFVDQLDGLVLQGGTDVAPETYGGQPIQDGRWPGDPHRDQYELQVLQLAMDRELPVFGICRGFQVMNCFFGGTLCQDIGTIWPDKESHRDAEQYDQLAHAVQLTPGKFFESLHADDSGTLVNSIHHQAVDQLGDGLEVLATSPDGIVEAFQWTGAETGKVMGVQWHPEFFHNHQGPLLDAERLYSHFLSFCR